MSVERKAATNTRKPGKPRCQDLTVALADREAELAEARRQQARLFDDAQAKSRDLEEALAQQTATGDVLKAISRTAFDLRTVLEILISSAARLCNAKDGQIFRRYRRAPCSCAPARHSHLRRGPCTAGTMLMAMESAATTTTTARSRATLKR
jgi:hypothetical protein